MRCLRIIIKKITFSEEKIKIKIQKNKIDNLVSIVTGMAKPKKKRHAVVANLGPSTSSEEFN